MDATPFGELDDYLALPRVSGLAMSADGSRMVTTIAELNEKRTEFVAAIWEVDPQGRRPARRLTRGARGESSPSFTADGDVLFIASRPRPDDDKPPAALWRLPADGGEAVEVLNTPGGITAVRTARDAGTAVVATPILPSAESIDDDRRLRRLRKDNEVTAILHTGYPVRFWDSELGPDQPHLVEANVRSDLTPQPGDALREAHYDISPDGQFVVTTWRAPAPGASVRSVLLRIDLETGERYVIAGDPGADLEHPAIAPDGSAVAFTRETVSTPQQSPRITLCRLAFGHDAVCATPGWDRWPASVAWSHDGAALIVTADQAGRTPIFRIDLGTSTITQLTDDEFAYTDVTPAPDGVLYALRSSYRTPPHPVRIDADGAVTVLRCIELPALPGELTEITAAAADGPPVRSWLVLPDRVDPAPLLLWIHGGPLGSWNSWHWRWNPWLFAAQGYAVLLPDPALSTGYGQDFVQRGWGAWGKAPYDDLMAATDAAVAHPRIDAARTAAMGGSFGGYMANWIAGHTDRFGAIVSHAGLWALDQFGSTTDTAYYWRREMTPEMAEANSPHRFVDRIATPMLVIHGNKDFRVPIGEGLRLWYELLARSALPADEHGGSPHRFLHFPTEHHWVLAPQHTKIWYQAVIGFLARHVLGQDIQLPELLG
ncbi:S9 family peptidase [Mycobacterium sp.]|uniref:S9 family peptidase n=1 Tax=Mycobacterium sp. TaxID=1785 RepID=UPI002D30739A|nr:S9 family peptidase [Mycobacterium sp.]HZA10930.1 S9 family peptidase [Mycobacterium sp.]